MSAGVQQMVSATASSSTTNRGPTRRMSEHDWVWLSVLGIFLIILGVAALAASAFTSLLSVLFLGWLLVFGGAVQTAHAFWARRQNQLFAHLAAGVLSLVIGVLF